MTIGQALLSFSVVAALLTVIPGLDRMRLVFDDAVRARETGMLGKWVGHPAQLFAVLLAADVALSDEAIEHEAAKLDAYATA